MNDLKSYARRSHDCWLRDMLLIIFVLGIPFLQYLGALPLIDPDEGRYAEIPREMLQRLDFITPTLNYVHYFEKPPLLYWLNAASMALFGQNELAARLPSALSGVATVLATYVIARRLYDRRSALISALILATSAGFVLQSRIILTDMLLTFCLTAALGAFIIAASQEKHRDRPSPWYMFYLFSALAVLAKGLIGVVFPAGIIFFYLLLGREWRIIKRMRLFGGALLFLAVTAPWFVAVSLHNPEFAWFFFIHEHFERFTSTIHGRYQPFWFFIPVLAGTMLPWSFFIPGALGHAWRNRHHEGLPGLFLLIWSVLIFLFFSKSSSKLVPYMLPIFPPLAIMISVRFCALLEGRGREIRLPSLILGSTMALLGCAAIGYANLPQAASAISDQIPSLAVPLKQFVINAPPVSIAAGIAIGALFILQGVVLLASSGQSPIRILVVLCLASFLLEILIPHLVMGSIAKKESPHELAMKIKSLATPDTRIVSFGPMQGVSWYTGRRLMVTGNLDELTFGSKQGDQTAWFPDLEALLRIWSSREHVLVILKKRELEKLSPQLKPNAIIVMDSGKRLLISNR